MIKSSINKLEFDNCIFNASGPKCTSLDELTNLNNSYSGAILTKSTTLEYRFGNECPRYYDNELGSINSMGLPNNGIDFYLDNSNKFNKNYIISVSGLTLDDNIAILTKIFNFINNSDKSKQIIHGIEINLSCPNIIGKGQLAYDFPTLDIFLNSIFKKINYFKTLLNEFNIPIIGVKLPPYFELNHFEIVGNILNNYSIDFITCINSIGNGLIIDYKTESSVIKPKNGIGGIGGDYVKPTGLSNVYNFYTFFKKNNSSIKIIGCGGIKTGIDVFEYILCGASLVQIGTHFYKEDTICFETITQELNDILKSKNYSSIEEFRGKLQSL